MGPFSFGQTPPTDIILWDANIHPLSRTVTHQYDYGNETYIREIYVKQLLPFGQQEVWTQISSLDAVMTGSGTETVNVTSLTDLQANYVVQIRLFPLSAGGIQELEEPRPTTGGFQVLESALVYISDEPTGVLPNLTFRIETHYGEMYPHDSLKMVIRVTETMTQWSPTIEIILQPGLHNTNFVPIHFPYAGKYEICAELWYKDAGLSPLWDWTFISSTCDNPLVVNYDISTAVDGKASEEDTFKVYPNPATDKITLEGFDQNVPVEMRDVTGRLVSTQLNSSSMDISGLTPGLYFLSQDGQSIKFIKKP